MVKCRRVDGREGEQVSFVDFPASHELDRIGPTRVTLRSYIRELCTQSSLLSYLFWFHHEIHPQPSFPDC